MLRHQSSLTPPLSVGGAAQKAGDGALKLTQGLGTVAGSGRGTQGSTSPGNEPSTLTPIRAANSMARSGGGASNVTSSSGSDIDGVFWSGHTRSVGLEYYTKWRGNACRYAGSALRFFSLNMIFRSSKCFNQFESSQLIAYPPIVSAGRSGTLDTTVDDRVITNGGLVALNEFSSAHSKFRWATKL